MGERPLARGAVDAKHQGPSMFGIGVDTPRAVGGSSERPEIDPLEARVVLRGAISLCSTARTGWVSLCGLRCRRIGKKRTERSE